MSHSKISFESCFTIENNFKNFNLSRCFQYVESAGKECYGPHFTIESQHFLAIQKIITYALQDEKNCLKLGIDIHKSLIISGPESSGKSAIIHLLKPFFGKRNSFEIHSSKIIAFSYARTGFEALQPFLDTGSKHRGIPSFCFDDFGEESVQKNFGNECDVMKEIMNIRYEIFISKRKHTHLITQLNASEIEKRYGIRMRNQFRAMFNLITF